MAKHEITIEYEFTSVHADGDNYTRTATIRAENESAALKIAHIVGFSEFGARFNDNCIDWRVAAR